MDRRTFIAGLGMAPLLLAPAWAAPARERKEAWQSRAAELGMLPNVPLVAHTGKRVRFYDDLVRGKTVLINFFLIGCTDGSCPTATANLRQVQDLLGSRMGRDIFFYSITLQPELDSPRALRDYCDNFDIRPGWTFLTGKPKDIDYLRRALGFAERDPEFDKDLNNHTGMARYGYDTLDRWGAVSLQAGPQHIASIFQWLNA